MITLTVPNKHNIIHDQNIKHKTTTENNEKITK